MYFFLQNFSFLEISFTAACIPRYLYDIATGDKIIAYNACVVQVFFTDLFAVTEFFLLAAMSYDRHVAICKPLHYVTIMSSRVCKRLVFCCWLAGLLVITSPLSLGLNLKFCDSNVIDHFLCDASPLMKISCSDTWFMEETVLLCALLTLIVTLICIVLSYAYFTKTILGFPSLQQRKRPFPPVFPTWLWFPSPMAPACSFTWILHPKKKWPLTKWFHCSFLPFHLP